MVVVGVAGVVVADAPKLSGGARAGEDPESLVSVISALVDVDEKLRLGLFQRGQSQQGRGDYEGAECQTFTACGGGG